jgi:hypothetical protein
VWFILGKAVDRADQKKHQYENKKFLHSLSIKNVPALFVNIGNYYPIIMFGIYNLAVESDWKPIDQFYFTSEN